MFRRCHETVRLQCSSRRRACSRADLSRQNYTKVYFQDEFLTSAIFCHSQPRSPVEEERDSGHSSYNSPRTPPGRKNECSFQRWPVPTPRAQAGPCFITSRASRGALCVRACFYAKGMPFRGATAVPKGPHPGASACRLPPAGQPLCLFHRKSQVRRLLHSAAS